MMKKTLKSISLLVVVLQLVFFQTAFSQVAGCTDPLASNFNPSATFNDGSCIYPATTVSSIASFPLDASLSETSGLIHYQGMVWTHNDNSDTNLYALDTLNGSILQTIPLPGVVNQEWEEISDDSAYIYLGDFGNNASGNRTDLHILRIAKSSLASGNPLIDTVWFSWSDQSNFAPSSPNTTDFDCEAFVAGRDSLYLFSKQWTSRKTKVYALPKVPGTFSAQLVDSFDVQGLVTGAGYREEDSLLVLLAYTPTLQSYAYLLYDFSGHHFFSANKRKITLQPGFHQTEGIASNDGLKYYVSNEYFSQSPITSTQKLQVYDLSTYLSPYLHPVAVSMEEEFTGEGISIHPNPAGDELYFRFPFQENFRVEAWSQIGLFLGVFENENRLDISKWEPGLYFLRISFSGGQYFARILHE